MKLIKINGKLWDLTKLWFGYDDTNKKLSEDANMRAIKHKDLDNCGIVRMLSKGIVKAKATAQIEIEVNGLKREELYDVYYSSKGYYCNIQRQRIYLEDLEIKKYNPANGGDGNESFNCV